MRIFKIEDSEYPEKLRKIKNPPKQIYVLGNDKILNEKSIAIIGSRNCTEKGAMIAQAFSKGLSDLGVNIVSGMAAGIDTMAHIGCMEGGSKTVAVLGSGFKHIFPKQNKKLLNEILENGGAIITEYEENVEVFSEGFVQRNRIVSGLSDGVLVVEAKKRSGTSITAKFAIEQEKTVFCIPHGLEEREGIGTNRLIKMGAKLITNIYDIATSLNLDNGKKQNIETHRKVPKEYEKIFNLIVNEAINVDEICKRSKMPIKTVNTILTILELEGYIVSMPGKMYRENKLCI